MGRSNVRAIVGIVFAASLAACDFTDHQPAAAESRSEAEIVDWIQVNSRRADPSTLILAKDGCLHLAKVSEPWSVEPQDVTDGWANGLILTADPDSWNLRPWEPSQKNAPATRSASTTRDIWGTPQDGKFRVEVSGWTPPNPAWASYMVASPKRIDENIRSGLFRRIALWNDEAGGLEAYQGAGGRSYVDSRRMTQCRDYGEAVGLIWCSAISRKEDFQFAFRFDGRDVQALPQALRDIESAIEATRGPCPKAGAAGAPKR